MYKRLVEKQKSHNHMEMGDMGMDKQLALSGCRDLGPPRERLSDDSLHFLDRRVDA